MTSPTSQPDDSNPNPSPRGRTFGLGGMLLVMLVCSFMAAAAYYLVQALGGDFARGVGLDEPSGANASPRLQLIFILIILAGPPILMIVVSIGYSVYSSLNKAGK